MRRIIATAAVLLGVAALLFLTLGSSSGSNGSATYKVQLDNAFGLVNGADFKVAGVIAGSIKSIDLDPKSLHAVVTVSVSRKGFGSFYSNTFCQSRPQSLIGEYFLDCDPGTPGHSVIPSGGTIPVTQTQSTIPADLVQNIMQLPYRQRFTILINELGAAVASRSEDLATALRRADPALAETDNLLALLANDAHTIRDLNANADTVVTALAKNSKQIQDFVVQADHISTDSATQAPNIEATWNKLPAFLEQLRPAMAKLGAAADAQDPVYVNLNAAASNLRTFFSELQPFSRESLPSLRSLGKAAVTGKPAVIAAEPLVTHLNQFSQHAPELAQNLAIVLKWIDDQKYAVEKDPRSPNGGVGFTGIEGLLQYVFNVTLATSYFGPYGHLLAVDSLVSPTCSPYTTPQTLANNIASDGLSAARSCYAFLGPNQPGVTTSDPTWKSPGTLANPSACVPDPGGYPVEPSNYKVSYHGAKTSVCKLAASSGAPAADKGAKRGASKPSATKSVTSTISSALSGATSGPGINLQSTIDQILSKVGGVPSAVTATSGSASDQGLSTSETQQLLNYLLAP